MRTWAWRGGVATRNVNRRFVPLRVLVLERLTRNAVTTTGGIIKHIGIIRVLS